MCSAFPVVSVRLSLVRELSGRPGTSCPLAQAIRGIRGQFGLPRWETWPGSSEGL